jgi:hypothetical protein
MTNKFIKVFFEEKQLSEQVYEINHGGMIHFIETGFVIDLIKRSSKDEQKKIEMILRKIDFVNGDVHHFLQHLATGYIHTNYNEAM